MDFVLIFNKPNNSNKVSKNLLKQMRESLMLSKTELARKAGISPVTITRIENGMPCRTNTKRKILLALGLEIPDKNKVFEEVKELFIHERQDRRLGSDRRKFSYHVHIPENRIGNDRRTG